VRTPVSILLAAIAAIASVGIQVSVGCGGSSEGLSTRDASVEGGAVRQDGGPSDAQTEASEPDGSTLKNPLKGLLDMGLEAYDGSADAGFSDNPDQVARYAPSFTGMVVNLTWGELQPAEGGTLGSGNYIDQELANVRTYNASHPSSPLAVKLRVNAGFGAPDWAKEIGGAPLPLTVTKSDGKVLSGTLGRYWTADYIAAWRAFQGMLAMAYDDEPLLREVSVTSCAAVTDEPFVPLQGQTVMTTLHAAGYSDANQKACLSGALDHYAAWKRTWRDFTFNVFTETDASPHLSLDPAFTTSVMQTCTTASHCILSTHYLDDPLAFKGDGSQDQNLFVYQEMKTQEAVSITDFQTASPVQLDWCGALANAYVYKGLSVELWPDFGGFTTFTPAQVANLATVLATGTPSDAGVCPDAK
jgi:hypothetical protein